MSRELTKEEVREQFYKHVNAIVHNWATTNLSDYPEGGSVRERIEGALFSFMVLLDGGTNLPGFIVAPCPHESDKDYCMENDEDWYPENHEAKVNCDISGSLHELWKRT